MKKIAVILSLLITVALSSAIGAYAATKYSLIVDGKKSNLDIREINGDAYVSAKKFGELLGKEVVVDSKKGTVTVLSPSSKAKAGEYEVDGFIFSDIRVEESISGFYKVTAKVKSTKAIKSALFTLAFYNVADNLVGSAVGSLDNTKKGEVTTVRFITTDDLAGWRKVKPLVDYQG